MGQLYTGERLHSLQVVNQTLLRSFSASLQPVTSASVHTVTSMQDDGPRPPCITMGSMHVLMMIHAISIGSHVA
jgi:hypothetical protein